MYVLAIDIGASSGRHILGSMQNGRLTLEEVYRFPNGVSEQNGHLCWDLNALWAHILAGMKECRRLGKIPASVGVDTWAVDFVLLDRQGSRIGDSVAYRDARTAEMPARLDFAKLYARTGIAMQPFNTVYQLMATPKEQLAQTARCLMIPDYFHYLLSGVCSNEFTNASTTALLNANTRDWDDSVFADAGIPRSIFPEKPRGAGETLGRLREEVAREVGFDCDVILPATHDTGSAYLAVPAADDHSVYLSSGTWSLLGVENARPILTDAARDAGFTNEGGVGGTTRFLKNIMGLWMLQCIRRELDDRYSFAEMADMAERGAGYRGSIDATDNRFLAPKRMADELRQALRDAKQPEPASLDELLACVTRSLAECYAREIRSLSALTGTAYTSVHIVGGGCQNRVLNQWTADATGLPVHAGPSEGTALGNVVAQLIAQGALRDLAQAREHIRKDFDIQTYQPTKG